MMNDRKPPYHFFSKRKVYLVVILAAVVLFALFFSLLSDAFVEGRNRRNQQQAPEATELVLTFAFQNPQWNAQIEQTVELFEQAYPQIHVTYVADYEHNVYEDVLSRRIARNELGDIVQLKTPAAYVEGGYLTPLPDHFGKEASYFYQKDGQTWAVGAVETTSGILYNKKLFEAYGLTVPASYDDFLKTCSTLKENGVIPVGVAGADLWHMEYWVNHFFRTDVLAGNENWLEDCAKGEVAWTDSEPIAMLEDMKALFTNGYVNADWRAVRDTSLPYMLQTGEVAMIFTGPWTAAGLQDTADFEAGWFIVPDREGRTFAARNQDTYWALTEKCAEDEAVYQAAVTFLEFFYSEENYGRICENTLIFPVKELTAKITDEKSIGSEIMMASRNSDDQMTQYIGDSSCPQNFEAEMLHLIEDYLDGDISSDDAAGQIQQSWENRMKTEGVYE